MGAGAAGPGAARPSRCAWWKAATAARNPWRMPRHARPGYTELVAVHDAVRPFIDIDILEKVFAEAAETGAAIVGIVPVDTVKQVHRNKIRQTIPRERLILAQTPQVFRFDLLKRRSPRPARISFTGTDESSLVERLDQVEVSVVPGSDRNIKITKPSDMDLARLFLAEETAARTWSRRMSGLRVGLGLGRSPHRRRPAADSGRRDRALRVRAGRPLRRRCSVARHHRCAAGRRSLWAISACISPIPIRAGRAATACCFCGTRATWRARKGYEIVNVDSTVILERPKLKDYRDAIREKLAETLGLDIDQVSVKFKTAEKVGPVGEGLSAEAQALATLLQSPAA